MKKSLLLSLLFVVAIISTHFVTKVTTSNTFVTTTTQQLGTHPLSYNGNTVYREGRGISMVWNNDSLQLGQNQIAVTFQIKCYTKVGNVKHYLDTLSIININPWVTQYKTITATPGTYLDPNTTLLVPPGTAGAVDQFVFWCSGFASVFADIDQQLIILSSQGKI